jgi:hypothetical protein
MKSSRFTYSLKVIYLAALALFFPLSTHLQAKTPAMLVTTELHYLNVDRFNPGSFKAEMAMEFRWNPKELPNFEFEPFVILNNIGEVSQQITLLPPRPSDGYVGALLLLRGTFQSNNDFAAYPFNHSRFSIVVRKLRDDFDLLEVKRPASGSPHDEKPLSYNFSVKDTGFAAGKYVVMWHSEKDFDKIQGVPSICYYVDTEHKPQRSIVMVILPLLLIWGITYSSQWWKDESASSRAIMASLFSAITLTFSAVNLQPDVSYFTAMNWAFAAYYLNFIALGTLTVIAFRANKRGDAVSFRRYRKIGRMLGVILLIGSALAIAGWIKYKRDLPPPMWLFHASVK